MNIGSYVGRFEIAALVGEGGMGRVYKAVDTELQRDVALKILRVDLTADGQFVERFRREAITQAKLIHPNIAQFYDLIREQGHWIMVMEFVDGIPLDYAIQQRSHFGIDEAIRVFNQVVDALDCAHKKGVIHRDIKPANIVLCPDGTAKVMDFGIARVVGDARVTKTGRLVGTPNYMAPEQILNAEVDARTDIYALGIVLYQMLTGSVPFSRTSEFGILRAQLEEQPAPLKLYGKDIPLGIERALLRAMAKEPAQRYGSAPEFKEALRIAREGNLPPEPQSGESQVLSLGGLNAPADTTRRKLPLAVAGIFVLSVAVLAAIFLVKEQQAPPPAPPPAEAATSTGTPSMTSPTAVTNPVDAAKPLPPVQVETKPETSVSPAKPIESPKPAPQKKTEVIHKPPPLPECPKGELERRLWEVEGKKCR